MFNLGIFGVLPVLAIASFLLVLMPFKALKWWAFRLNRYLDTKIGRLFDGFGGI